MFFNLVLNIRIHTSLLSVQLFSIHMTNFLESMSRIKYSTREYNPTAPKASSTDQPSDIPKESFDNINTAIIISIGPPKAMRTAFLPMDSEPRTFTASPIVHRSGLLSYTSMNFSFASDDVHNDLALHPEQAEA